MTPLRFPKKAYICHNGPFVGETLWLASASTLVFTYQGKTGRYVSGGYDFLVRMGA